MKERLGRAGQYAGAGAIGGAIAPIAIPKVPRLVKGIAKETLGSAVSYTVGDVVEEKLDQFKAYREDKKAQKGGNRKNDAAGLDRN